MAVCHMMVVSPFLAQRATVVVKVSLSVTLLPLYIFDSFKVL